MSVKKAVKDLLEKEFSSYIWTVDYFEGEGNRAVVIGGAGTEPTKDDVKMRFPNIQVWLRSKNFSDVEETAEKIFEKLHGKTDLEVDDSKVFYIEALGEPIPVGYEKGYMEYSINFKITFMKEVINNE